MAELIRWVDYNLTTGSNNGTSETDAFRGTDALNYAISNMDAVAKDCTGNDHVLRIVIKGVGKSNTGMTIPQFDSSYNTDLTRYIQIEVKESEKHSGYIDSQKFLIFITGDALWFVQSEPQSIRFKNMQFRFHNWGAFQLQSSLGSINHYQFENCVFDNTNGTRFTVLFSTRGFYDNGSYFKCINCIFSNFNKDYADTHGCINFNWQTSNTQMFFYNCQFNNVNTIIYDNYTTGGVGNVTYINCMFDDVLKKTNSETTTYITENVNCKNNSSNTALNVSVGSDNISNQTFTFQDEVSNIFLITYYDTGAKGKGTNNTINGYTTDIIGSEREIPWDIGAFSSYSVPVPPKPEPPGPTPEPETDAREFRAACFVDKDGNFLEWSV